MIDPKLLRHDMAQTIKTLMKKNVKIDFSEYERLEQTRVSLQSATEALQAKRNQLSKAVGVAKSSGEDATDLLAALGDISASLKKNEAELSSLQHALKSFLLQIPNLPHADVPEGRTESDNVEIKRWGEPRSFDFTPRDHVALGEGIGCMDFVAGAKLSGSRFVVVQAALAKLQRALGQFMLNLHTEQHGYQEVSVPYLVKKAALYGTGQLPKFDEDQFNVSGDSDLTLIPTAEVPLTNLVRESVLPAERLPLKLTALTPCFRSEAGSYGKDVKGMIRLHQFEKVELVQITTAEAAQSAHEEMLGHAEKVLQLLQLPYRLVLLCGGDTGFSAAKTVDIEVWLPGQNQYREISSVSLCGSFQARRMMARYKTNASEKPVYCHTLNGSGVAVGRALVAVLENYQTAEGDILVPEVLLPYMGGIQTLSAATVSA